MVSSRTQQRTLRMAVRDLISRSIIHSLARHFPLFAARFFMESLSLPFRSLHQSHGNRQPVAARHHVKDDPPWWQAQSQPRRRFINVRFRQAGTDGRSLFRL